MFIGLRRLRSALAVREVTQGVSAGTQLLCAEEDLRLSDQTEPLASGLHLNGAAADHDGGGADLPPSLRSRRRACATFDGHGQALLLGFAELTRLFRSRLAHDSRGPVTSSAKVAARSASYRSSRTGPNRDWNSRWNSQCSFLLSAQAGRVRCCVCVG